MAEANSFSSASLHSESDESEPEDDESEPEDDEDEDEEEEEEDTLPSKSGASWLLLLLLLLLFGVVPMAEVEVEGGETLTPGSTKVTVRRKHPLGGKVARASCSVVSSVMAALVSATARRILARATSCLQDTTSSTLAKVHTSGRRANRRLLPKRSVLNEYIFFFFWLVTGWDKSGLSE